MIVVGENTASPVESLGWLWGTPVALRVENGGFVSQRQKGPASCVIPLPHPTETTLWLLAHQRGYNGMEW